MLASQCLWTTGFLYTGYRPVVLTYLGFKNWIISCAKTVDAMAADSKQAYPTWKPKFVVMPHW